MQKPRRLEDSPAAWKLQQAPGRVFEPWGFWTLLVLTPRGWLFFVAVLGLVGLALAVGNSLLALVGLTLLSWFLASWLFFAVRLRLALPRLSVEREIRDPTGPVDGLWAGQTFSISAQLRNDSFLGLPY